MRASVLSAGIPVNRETALGFFLCLFSLLLRLVSLFLHLGVHGLFGFADLLLGISGGLLSLLFGVCGRVGDRCFHLFHIGLD